MDELLKWYQLLSHSKSFKWAKFWGLVLAMLLAGLGYFWLNGHGFEALLILGLPIVFAASNSLESLSLAYQYSLLMQQVSLKANNNQEEADRAQPQAAVPLLEPEQEATTSQPNSVTTEVSATDKDAVFELRDDEKLVLCQFYVFLYVLFHLRKVGEETTSRLIGMPVWRYRQWLKRLAAPGVELVEIIPGKTTTVAELAFEEVLVRLAEHDRLSPSIWDFPKAVYADERNWRPSQSDLWEIVPGRKVRINNRLRREREGNTSPLLPIYPERLKDLKI